MAVVGRIVELTGAAGSQIEHVAERQLLRGAVWPRAAGLSAVREKPLGLGSTIVSYSERAELSSDCGVLQGITGYLSLGPGRDARTSGDGP